MPPQAGLSGAFPAPVGGWNARDPIDLMPPEDALRLQNVVPTPSSAQIRKGFREHADGMGSSVVDSLFNQVSAAGVEKLIAVANSNIYDATTFDSSASSLKSGLTNNRWQGVNFRNRLIICNGEDTPQQYDGTTLSDANYSGSIGANEAEFINVTAFRNRLYFLRKDSNNYYYGGVNEITGDQQAIDVASLLTLGGTLLSISTWSFDAGSGPDEHLVLLSDQGEGLVWAGSYPGSLAWTLVGRFFLPRPCGRRCMFKMGTNTVVITEQGIIPLTGVMLAGGPVGQYEALTGKINTVFNEAARSTIATFGWQGLVYPRGQLLYVNYPKVAGVESQQFVMHTVSGGWAKFTGMNAQSWVVHKRKPYFGGTDGKVYEADQGATDDSNFINIDVKTSFNYFGDRTKLKQFTLARPVLTSNTGFSFKFGMDVDGSEEPLSGTVEVTNSAGDNWDEGLWDVALWDNENVLQRGWYSVNGLGRCGAFKMRAQLKSVDFKVTAFHVNYNTGSLL